MAGFPEANCNICDFPLGKDVYLNAQCPSAHHFHYTCYRETVEGGDAPDQRFPVLICPKCGHTRAPPQEMGEAPPSRVLAHPLDRGQETRLSDLFTSLTMEAQMGLTKEDSTQVGEGPIVTLRTNHDEEDPDNQDFTENSKLSWFPSTLSSVFTAALATTIGSEEGSIGIYFQIEDRGESALEAISRQSSPSSLLAEGWSLDRFVQGGVKAPEFVANNYGLEDLQVFYSKISIKTLLIHLGMTVDHLARHDLFPPADLAKLPGMTWDVLWVGFCRHQSGKLIATGYTPVDLAEFGCKGAEIAQTKTDFAKFSFSELAWLTILKLPPMTYIKYTKSEGEQEAQTTPLSRPEVSSPERFSLDDGNSESSGEDVLA